MDDLMRFAKKNPADVSYATTGQGSPQQLAMQLLAQKTGIGKMVEVPYKGSSPAHPDLISQRVTVMIDPAAAVFGHIQSGALRALAVTTAKRIDGLPDVPTVGESGVPGYEVSSWGGMFAPAGTPPDVISRLNGELEKILSTADVKSRFAGLGLVAKHSSADELGQFLKSEITQWRTVMTAGSK
jgi:tripartite-type tricarboxylate transporter receptor subunit TctC